MRRHARNAIVLVLALAALAAGAHAVLADGPLSDQEVKANMAAKAATEQRLAAAQQAGRAVPQPSGDPNRGAGVPIGPASPLPTGIFTKGQPPFSPEQYMLTSFWRGIVGSEYVTVYAGALTADPTQGVVVLQTVAAKDLGPGSPGGELRSPSRVGRLVIDSANGSVLHLVASNGAAFTFDASRRTFAAAP